MPSFIRVRAHDTGQDILVGTHAISSISPEKSNVTHTRIYLVNGNHIVVNHSVDQIQAALVNTDECPVGLP